MINLSHRRRIGRGLARAGALVSAAMLISGLTAGGQPAGAAGVDSGTVQIRDVADQLLVSGGSSTEFKMVPPSGAACSGSGASGYSWQTFFVDDGVDVSALTYAGGPDPVSGHFVSPLYDSVGGNPVADMNPAAAPVGLIGGVPTFSFAAFGPGMVAAGDYKVGFACTKDAATEKFWTGRITITMDASDSPAGFTWTVAAPPAPPITNLTASQIAGPGVRLTWTPPTGSAPTDYSIGVSPTVPGAPFTAPAGSTTFDVSGLTVGNPYTLSVTANYATAPLTGPTASVSFTYVNTTTTIATTTTHVAVTTTAATTTTTAATTTTAETTTTAAATTTTTRNAAAAPVVATSSTTPFVSTLATTGDSSVPVVMWALLLLVLGRFAVLVARPLRVRPPGRR